MVDSLLGIANYYQIPSIVISPTGTMRHTDEFVGNPFNPSYNPQRYSEYSDRMCLKQRLINTITAIFDELSYTFMYIPSQEIIYRRYFNELKPKDQADLPPLIDLVHNVSLVFVNSHNAINYPRAFVPNMIEVGGIHIKNETYIAKDAEKYMEPFDGVIYFSLGTKIKSKDLPDDKRNAFVNVFKAMHRFSIFWKWENATLVNQSDNVVIGPWLPQQDLLAHPSVKLFITHGGQLSEMEGVYFRTPMIGIPVTDEDRLNIVRATKKGYMRMLDYNNITEESITEAINDVLNNPSYQEAVNRAADLFKLNAIHPLDNAVYHVEYVLKTKGAHHLRTSVVQMPFWKSLMIDVTLIIVTVLLLIVSIPFVITLYILRRNYNKTTRTKNDSKNKPPNSGNNNDVVTKNKNSMVRDKKNANKLKHH
jgi:glucuronosyltransferase